MTSVEQPIDEYLYQTAQAIAKLDRTAIAILAQLLLDVYNKDGTVYVFGNGGSASTASHACGDFVRGASHGLARRFDFRCLSDNTTALTSVANDISYDDVFVEQLRNSIREFDLVIGVSGSGNSENVARALEYAKSNGIKAVAFCGFNGGRAKRIADLAIHVPVNDMEIAEDLHLMIWHCLKRIAVAQLNADQSIGPKYAERLDTKCTS